MAEQIKDYSTCKSMQKQATILFLSVDLAGPKQEKDVMGLGKQVTCLKAKRCFLLT